jgi:Uma2 family endonuclease
MTASQFLMLGEDPPGLRLELVDGEVAVSPSPTPRHSFVVVQMIAHLASHVNEHDLGELHHDVDTILDQFNVRRPDILFFAKSRIGLIGEKAMQGPPDLAIEVLSPSSVEVDRKDKFEQYRKAGVKHYWIIDPVLRTIEAWTLKGRRYVLVCRGQGAAVVRLPPFNELDIPLSRLWRGK